MGFKRDLVKEVQAFVQDAQAFRKDWEANGPMVPGLEPMEAVDRLKKFQQMFEVRAFMLKSPDVGTVDRCCLGCTSKSSVGLVWKTSLCGHFACRSAGPTDNCLQ